MGEINATLAAKLEQSGLTPEHAEALEIVYCTKQDCAKLFATHHISHAPEEGFVLPYFNASYEKTGFWRWRYLTLPAQDAFAKASGQKLPKYVQPPNTICEVYLAPIIDWLTVVAKRDIRLIITEGELKAAAGCDKGLPCVGLGGVDSFSAVKKGFSILPTMEQIDWRGREVLIVFDSDIGIKPAVAAAQIRLGRALLAQGAKIKFGTLPNGPGNAKQGLDDYFLHATAEDFEEQIAKSAQEFNESSAMHQLNEELYFVRNIKAVVEMRTGDEMSVADFKNSVYANRTFLHTAMRETGVKIEMRAAAPHWMKWPQRREYDRYVYEPGKPLEYDRVRNRWTGWPVVPKPGAVALWHKLLDVIFRDETPEARAWFEQWVAYPFQHPGTKLFTCVVLYSEAQGVGKSLLGETIMRLYGNNASTVQESELYGHFNPWAKDCQFVLGEEAKEGDARPADVYNTLKYLITRDKVRINEKHVKQYEVRDCINYMLPTNNGDAYVMADGDRRVFVVEIVEKLEAPEWYSKTFVPWAKSEAGKAALFDYLLNLDLTGFDPTAPAPDTASKKRMLDITKTDVGAWLRAVKEDSTNLYAGRVAELRNCDLWPLSELYMRFTNGMPSRATLKSFAIELKRAGFLPAANGERIETKNFSSTRFTVLWAVRNPLHWFRARGAEAKAHWEGREGAMRKAKGGYAGGEARF